VALPFRFDFYLHEHNACIEYDGQLHYYPIKHFGGMKRLIETQKNDLIKTDYCVKRGIRLLRIPFFEINNIEKLIKDFLC
jgi:very-short-patch-repair endonuclease